MFARVVLAALFSAACAVAAVASPPQINGASFGAFALTGAMQKTVALMAQTPDGTMTDVRIQYRLWNRMNPIRRFDVDMTKLMHLVIVSDDLQTFEHLHPGFDAQNGWFHERLAANPKRRYYVYADAEPAGVGQQVFRFTLNPDTASPQPMPSFTPSPRTMRSGPYNVTLASTTLSARHEQEIDVTIARHGAPATDLQPYLGAPAHVVFINTATLQYAHVHPMSVGDSDAMSDMPGMDMGGMGGVAKATPHLQLHVPALAAGTYRMWFQFQGGGALHAVPFTMVAR